MKNFRVNLKLVKMRTKGKLEEYSPPKLRHDKREIKNYKRAKPAFKLDLSLIE